MYGVNALKGPSTRCSGLYNLGSGIPTVPCRLARGGEKGKLLWGGWGMCQKGKAAKEEI